MSEWTAFAAGVAVLALGTAALARWARIGLGWLPVMALVRAVVQLAVVALLLRGILDYPATVVGFLVLMLSTASVTAGGRLRDVWHGRRAAIAGVVAGGGASVGAVLLLGLVDLEVRYVIAVAGIVIGNAMSAATLSGRALRRTARDRAGEIEAWFALGARPAQAHAEVAREAVRESLLPTFDQTRSTGLVTLPGAFVGALFGGASPIEAARFQLVVLAGIALAMLISGLVVTRIVSGSPYVTCATGRGVASGS